MKVKEHYVDVSGIGHSPSSPGMASLAVTLPIIPPSSRSLLIQSKSGSHARSKFFKKKKNHHLSTMHSIPVWLVHSIPVWLRSISHGAQMKDMLTE